MHTQETCWNNTLTQDQKDEEVFIGKCGECQVQHEYPKCDQCKQPRQKSGPCSECNHSKKKEEPYQGYCGNCFQIHEYPTCVQCQHYRLKPGRCTNCGVIGPDCTEWIYTCLNRDDQYEELMRPVLEARKIKIAENTKKFTTYKNCPLCKGYFHSAKACIFRTHVEHFNILQKKMEQFSDEVTTGRLVVGTPNLDSDSDSEDEVYDDIPDDDDESENGAEGTYMMIIHHGDSSEEEEDDSFPFDKILTIATRRKQEDQKREVETEQDREDQEREAGAKLDEEDQKEEDQNEGSQQTQPKDDILHELTECQLTKRDFATSICRVLPDTAEFPEDIFNIEGCIWCGSKDHDVYNCLGYGTWLGNTWLGPVEERRLPYPQRQKRIEAMLKEAKTVYQNPRRPWELYIGLDDGEYLTEKGVKIKIQNQKIVNLIPRHLQTTTTIYPDLPTAKEMGRMLQLSTTIQPAAHTTVMEELCNQAVCMKEDMLELEVELKRSLGEQITNFKKEVRQELHSITTMIEDKVTNLPQQLVSFREHLSKSLSKLHQRSMQSEITLVKSYRELTEAKTPDSCMVWRSAICKNDPSYHLRGRWTQLTDRLNNITEYTLRSNLVVPITDEKHIEELKKTSVLIGEVMTQLFQQSAILERDDMYDIEDYHLFQEAVCRTLQMQAISANQICNFIQQILYYNQCEKRSFTAYMDLQRQLEVFIGILLQTTLKVWDKPGHCHCDFTARFTCKHAQKYSILREHFPTFGLVKTEELLAVLNSISNQTCDCSHKAALPMHGPSSYIKAPIPTYSHLQELHEKQTPDLPTPVLQELYVRAISSWIYARLYMYLTPYTDPSMNKDPGPLKLNDWEFYNSEKKYLENKLCILFDEPPISTIWEKVLELGDLKKNFCQCIIHQEDREVNLLYQLKLHNTGGNRELAQRVLKSKPLGFPALISSCKQINGTPSQCNLLLYEVTPTTAGTFQAVEQHCKPQPHLQMKSDYCDYSNNSLVHICRDQQDNLSIYNLLAQVKGESMVEEVTDGVETFQDSEEESDYSESTSSSSIPDLVDSYYSCQII